MTPGALFPPHPTRSIRPPAPDPTPYLQTNPSSNRAITASKSISTFPATLPILPTPTTPHAQAAHPASFPQPPNPRTPSSQWTPHHRTCPPCSPCCPPTHFPATDHPASPLINNPRDLRFRHVPPHTHAPLLSHGTPTPMELSPLHPVPCHSPTTTGQHTASRGPPAPRRHSSLPRVSTHQLPAAVHASGHAASDDVIITATTAPVILPEPAPTVANIVTTASTIIPNGYSFSDDEPVDPAPFLLQNITQSAGPGGGGSCGGGGGAGHAGGPEMPGAQSPSEDAVVAEGMGAPLRGRRVVAVRVATPRDATALAALDGTCAVAGSSGWSEGIYHTDLQPGSPNLILIAELLSNCPEQQTEPTEQPAPPGSKEHQQQPQPQPQPQLQLQPQLIPFRVGTAAPALPEPHGGASGCYMAAANAASEMKAAVGAGPGCWSGCDAGSGGDRMVVACVGLAAGCEVAGEVSITNLAVAPGLRGEGLGRRLMAELLWRLGSERYPTFLEVRQDNSAAQALYSKLNFEVVGRRRRYYADGCDSLIMCRPPEPWLGCDG